MDACEILIPLISIWSDRKLQSRKKQRSAIPLKTIQRHIQNPVKHLRRSVLWKYLTTESILLFKTLQFNVDLVSVNINIFLLVLSVLLVITGDGFQSCCLKFNHQLFYRIFLNRVVQLTVKSVYNLSSENKSPQPLTKIDRNLTRTWTKIYTTIKVHNVAMLHNPFLQHQVMKTVVKKKISQ